MAYNPWDPGSSAEDDGGPQAHGGRAAPPPYAPPPFMPPGSARSTFTQSCLVAGCATLLAPIVLFGGFFMLIFALATSGGQESTGGTLGTLYPPTAGHNLRERVVRPGSGSATIAIVSISGVIDGGGSPLEGDGALALVSQQLRAAAEDDDVLAVILQIDSPGGGLTASDLLYHEVVRLRERGKPVLAWAGSMMASGGYYIAVAAEEIMASPTATVGSIGVILQHFQIRDMLDKLGVKVNPIVSGAHKDLASPFRDMTPEERALLQDYIDKAHRRFVSVVAEGRGMPEDAVRALADGSIYPAETALNHGLVDSVGYIEDAVAWAERKTGRKNMRIVAYRRMFSLGDIFREAGQGAASALIGSAAAPASPRPMALWEGGNQGR